MLNPGGGGLDPANNRAFNPYAAQNQAFGELLNTVQPTDFPEQSKPNPCPSTLVAQS